MKVSNGSVSVFKMTKENRNKNSSRRRFLKNVGVTTAALSLSGVAGAAPDGNSTSTTQSEPREPTKEERRIMQKREKKAVAEIKEDSHSVYARRYEEMQEAQGGVSTNDVIGSVPSLGCSDSYGTQYANWENSNDSSWAQVGSFTNAYTKTSGLTNKAETICDAVAGDDLWAWAETGVVFDTEASGRLECTASGFIRGQNFAQVPCGGVADANLNFYLLGYNLTDGKVASGPSNGTVTIDKFGVDLFGFPKNVNRSYSQALKLDVQANKRYIFVAKVYGSSFAVGCARGVSDADENYNAALDPADWDGYHQMYNMGLSWNSCN